MQRMIMKKLLGLIQYGKPMVDSKYGQSIYWRTVRKYFILREVLYFISSSLSY